MTICAEGRLSLRCFLASAVSLFSIVFLWMITQTEIDLQTIFIWNAALIGVVEFLLYYLLPTEKFQIAVRATFLGFVFGTGILIVYFGTTPWKPFGFYVLMMAIFHFSEYYAVALSNPKSLSTDSFILNHSFQYAAAAVSSWIEFLIEIYFWPGLKEYFLVTWLGIVLCVSGEVMRKMAIITASSNFNHLVQFNKANDHQLVTHGIYGLMRHPSYVGWFWWSIGTQIILINPLCIVIYALVSWTFFSSRVTYEELTLLNFFGRQYVEYQEKVPTGLPFIKGYVLN